MKSQQIKSSFQSGVLSPRLSLRGDLEKYATALEQSVNFIVNPQGGIVMREGFQNMGLIGYPSAPNRIFQFHKGGNESDMLVEVTAGDELIRFRVDGQLLTDEVDHGASGNTPYLQAELDDLYFTNSEVTGVICHADHPPMYIEIALDGTITGTYLPVTAIPYVDYRDANSPVPGDVASETYTATFVDGTSDAWEIGKNWTFKYDGKFATGGKGNVREWNFTTVTGSMEDRLEEAMSLLPDLTAPGMTVSAVSAGGNAYTINMVGPNSGKLLEIQARNPIATRSVGVTQNRSANDLLENAWSYPTYVQHPDGGGNYFQCIKANSPEDGVNDPTETEYWTDLGASPPDTFDWQYPDGNIWTEYDPLTFTKSYYPGGRGFPTVAVIHQQRLILMANPGFTMGVFGSRINQYKDFVRGPQDDDPFFFALDTSDTPTIKWAESQQDLIIGTSSGDYNLAAQVILSASDIQALKQNNARSHGAKAVTVNTEIFYIEQGKEKVRATGYLDSVDARSSNDVSQIAEHLLNVRAKRIVLMQTPEVVVFILRDDGSLVAISYSHEQKTAAWYELESQGEIVDLAVCYTSSTGHTPDPYDPTDPYNTMNTDEDELWVTITYDGGVTYHAEKMPYPKRVFQAAQEPGDLFLVDQHLVNIDGWVRGTIATEDNNVIDGLEQFAGLTVACMVEDAWTGEYVVSAEGIIILDAAEIEETYSGTYSVGLRYIATAKTFEMAGGNQRGSAIGTKRRWNRLWVKTLDSALPVINGKLPPDRSPETLMGMAEIIQEGLQDVQMRGVGWGNGSITIVQDRPYPTNLIGFAGEYSTNNA